MKENTADKKMRGKHNYSKKFMIILPGLFFSAIMGCFFCLASDIPPSGIVQDFRTDLLDFAEMLPAEPLVEQNIFENFQLVRDPVCKRNVSRRQFKFFHSVSAVIFRFVPVEVFAIKISAGHIFQNFYYTPLQLENSLFIRDGPVTDVDFKS